MIIASDFKGQQMAFLMHAASFLCVDQKDWRPPYIPKMALPYTGNVYIRVKCVSFMAFFTALSFTFIIPPIMKRIVQEKFNP